ncbi:hypothetical protein QN277_007208 [Acacia crassicarpa]|uniref:Uncharacterized protein n=1 Tax=Acacia crassicarpa TaxID=499986 RepID=A0AAE1JU58_9FABA|nr:hypothetical protein QN277_007208 [Acacia crassicarpa]
MQSYTECLSSILTVHKLQSHYPSEYDVLNDPNIKIEYQGGSFIKGLLEKLKVDKSRVKNYSAIEDYKDALGKGSRKGGVDVIFDEVPHLKAFPRGSSLTSHFSTAILSVREIMEMDEIEHKYFGSSDNDEDQSLSNSSSDNESSSSLTSYSFV